MAVDRKGRPIAAGDVVIVIRDQESSLAKVVRPTGVPTVSRPGEWVDVDLGGGAEGMPSYMLEVLSVE